MKLNLCRGVKRKCGYNIPLYKNLQKKIVRIKDFNCPYCRRLAWYQKQRNAKKLGILK